LGSGEIVNQQAASAAFRKTLRRLGLSSERAEDALVAGLKVFPGVDPVRAQFEANRKAIILLSGIACRYRLLEDGNRQIVSIYFPGDISNLPSFDRGPLQGLALGALTDCTFGTLDFDLLDEQMEQHPSLALALWRASILEIFVARTWLLNTSQKAAVERVAHLICELLARQEASGMSNRSILLHHLDIADAVGLSAVHVNRSIQALRDSGALSDVGRGIKVVDREKLERIAEFDGEYLTIGPALLRWDVKLQLG
jgi:CRP-like cAMP-binding protein